MRSGPTWAGKVGLANRAAPGTVRLLVKAVPGAKRDEIAGWLGDRLKVRVCAPPEGGRANEAIRELLCTTLGVGSHQVSLERGAASPLKVFAIRGMRSAEIVDRLPPRT